MTKPRGYLFRVVAATMAIWLGLVITEPLPLDACPMHGAHTSHGMMAASHGAHHTPGGHHSPKPASHQCTCIGDCSTATTSIAFLPASIGAPEAPIAAVVERPRQGALISRASSREHKLPPANGPPSIS